MLEDPSSRACSKATGRCRFPDEEPSLPDRFRGLPVLDHARCPERLPRLRRGVSDRRDRGRATAGCALDLGRCLFCTDCAQACPEGAIEFTPRLPARGAATRRW